MVTSYRSPIKLEVSGEGTAATARGGLVLLFEVLAARRILVGLPRAGGSPAQGWSDAQMILAVLVLNVAGFDRVRMKRIRAVWIHLVARVVHHGRQAMLVVGGAGAHRMAARQRMILAMPPPDLSPG